MYIRMMGAEGLTRGDQGRHPQRQLHRQAARGRTFPVLYRGATAWSPTSASSTCAPGRSTAGIEVEDVAKRLMDYGFHAPTMSFPVAGTLMIEPTESEQGGARPLLRRDDRHHARDRGRGRRGRPRRQPAQARPAHRRRCPRRLDRTLLARAGRVPAAWTRDQQVLAAVGRVDNVYGDRNLVCSCGAALERCLAALRAQESPPELEVLVPFDASADVAHARAAFPDARFLPMGQVAVAEPVPGESGRHELYDRRRSAGLAAARGELVALLEDRGAPGPRWARAMVDLHRGRRLAAAGGAIACGSREPWSRAVFLCDFGRYEPPLAPGPARALSDTNVCYRREDLLAVRAEWEPRFHEPRVHAALAARGGALWLDPAPVVEQARSGLGVRRLLAERYHWGSLYGRIRARGLPPRRRRLYALLAPLLPPLLLWRIVRGRAGRPGGTAGALALAPRLLLLLAAWSAGESAGYRAGPLPSG
jgi:hypothetical protein